MSDLLSRDVLVISQKPKFVEMTNEYAISAEDGTPLGVVRQEGQSKARKLLRPGSISGSESVRGEEARWVATNRSD